MDCLTRNFLACCRIGLLRVVREVPVKQIQSIGHASFVCSGTGLFCLLRIAAICGAQFGMNDASILLLWY